MNLFRKHAACTNGVRNEDSDFFTFETFDDSKE
jgi:hypothetical protein